MSDPAPAAGGEIALRHCHGLADFAACMEIERRVWGEADLLVPLPLFVVAVETGGQVFAAYDGVTMAGFTMALAGARDGHPYLHSHMTAVLPEYRDRGIGRQLKLFQRQGALARGIELVEWTFDPLEIKNAYFNLVRLGAIARRYLPNCYGVTTSPLHAGLPTDRLVAEWWLRSPRVEAVLSAAVGQRKPTPVASLERIRVPATIDDLRRTNPAEAGRAQTEIRRQFLDAFSRGLVAVGLELHPGGADYLLEPGKGSRA